MENKDFDDLIHYIVKRCVDLKNKYVADKTLVADYICVFSHNKQECEEFIHHASFLGKIAEETKTGPIFKFYTPPKTLAGNPKVLKIRMPDDTRKEKGDVDFITDYTKFKSTYLDNKRFTLIKRERFEMIELKDSKYDVLVYFSSIPPSKLLEIK